VTIDDEARRWAFAKTHDLRLKGVRVEIDYLGRSVKAQMREANRQEALYTVVIGGTELLSRSARLKNMQTGGETAVDLDGIESAIQS
jgi:histidyl-tRNA synthetase